MAWRPLVLAALLLVVVVPLVAPSRSSQDTYSNHAYCMKYICPWSQPPSCQCPNQGGGKWTRKRRALEGAFPRALPRLGLPPQDPRVRAALAGNQQLD